jgi:hypothetical protein
MAWPFPESTRPLMRSVLWQMNRGLDLDAVRAVLTGPAHRHPESAVDLAIPEALRSEYFREAIEGSAPTASLRSIWDAYAAQLFRRAYGRDPLGQELGWWLTTPGSQIGLMFEVTGQGSSSGAQLRYTVTANAQWDMSIAELKGAVREAMLSGLIITRTGGTDLLLEGTIQIALIGGALVPRIEPTLTITRRS